MVLTKVQAGDEILSAHHNELVDAVETKITQEQAEAVASAKVTTEIKKLVGAAPETLDTLEEIAKAIAENKSVEQALQESIASKADKTYVDTGLAGKADKTALSGYATTAALNSALNTSDKHKSITFDQATNSLVITYKDGTKTSVVIPAGKAVYA